MEKPDPAMRRATLLAFAWLTAFTIIAIVAVFSGSWSNVLFLLLGFYCGYGSQRVWLNAVTATLDRLLVILQKPTQGEP